MRETTDSFLLKCGGQILIVTYDDKQEINPKTPTNILCRLHAVNGDSAEVYLTANDVKALIYMLHDAVKRTNE